MKKKLQELNLKEITKKKGAIIEKYYKMII
jgi:hypothetical protein